MDSKVCRIGEGEHREITLVFVPGSASVEPLVFELAGPGASLDLACLYLCDGNDTLDFDVSVRHLCSGCTSRQLFKGVCRGRSKMNFNGLIYVAPDSQKTKAYQECHTLLLSPTALAQASPQLEIYADDVECSHGATVGSLSEEELFYMRSRGIPEAEARRLQIISFISPVLSRLEEDRQREILELL